MDMLALLVVAFAVAGVVWLGLTRRVLTVRFGYAVLGAAVLAFVAGLAVSAWL
jgi:multisubunit Na+/H+ antiporter MnhC subunit